MPAEPVLTYDSDRRCPKCQAHAKVRGFGTVNDYVRGHSGELHETATLAGATEPDPHLIVRCMACGWEWLTETSDARQGSAA